MKEEITDVGDQVICDICNQDWTGRPESGGFLFGSKAYCPDCATSGLESIKRYNEQKHIKAFCPPGKSFAKWVVEDLRQGDNRIIFRTGTIDEIFPRRPNPRNQ